VADMSERTETLHPPRSDDAAGEGFAVKLAAMKRQVAKRKAMPIAKPDFEWFVDDVEPGADEEWMITASPPGFFLGSPAETVGLPVISLSA
jgi:hypothetical protein